MHISGFVTFLITEFTEKAVKHTDNSNTLGAKRQSKACYSRRYTGLLAVTASLRIRTALFVAISENELVILLQKNVNVVHKFNFV